MEDYDRVECSFESTGMQKWSTIARKKRRKKKRERGEIARYPNSRQSNLETGKLRVIRITIPYSIGFSFSRTFITPRQKRWGSRSILRECSIKSGYFTCSQLLNHRFRSWNTEPCLFLCRVKSRDDNFRQTSCYRANGILVSSSK